jgi:hypothetical protein
MSVFVPVILFVSWLAFFLVPVGRLAIEDPLAGIPKNQRRGTSILPGFPIIPLVLWGLAWLLDRIVSPWSTLAFVCLHALLLGVSLLIIIRDILRLRRISQPKA